MTIVRAPRPERGWTSISNDTLRDERLSYRARGILAAILSRPDNWRTNSDSLAREGREGRDAVRSALRELVDGGYMVVEKVRNEAGQIVTLTTVYDRPTGDWSTGDWLPGAGMSGSIRKNEKKEREETPPTPPETAMLPMTIVDDSNGFEWFWEEYPRKAGKRVARTAYERALARLVPVHGATVARRMIMDGVRQYANDPNREGAYTAHPSTWLNQDRWEDEPLPPRITGRLSATALYLGAADELTFTNLPALEA